MDEKILERLARDGRLHSLSDIELRITSVLLTIDPDPKPVKAWVRFGDTPVQVRARAERWTPDAVGVSFTVGQKTMRCWVWASACTPDDSRPPQIAP